MDNLRQQLAHSMSWNHSHSDVLTVLARVPADISGWTHESIPYSPWQLLEHMRITQWDILEFSRDPKHVSPDWPDGYWPRDPAPADPEEWHKSLTAFRRDLEAMQAMVVRSSTDLMAPIPHGEGQTVLREALLVLDHNAYHLGQMVLLLRLAGRWPA